MITELSRRDVLHFGLGGILAAGFGPAIVRATSLMAVRPFGQPTRPEDLIDFFAARISYSTGFCEALWKHSLILKAKSLVPRQAAITAIQDLVARGAAEVPYPGGVYRRQSLIRGTD